MSRSRAGRNCKLAPILIMVTFLSPVRVAPTRVLCWPRLTAYYIYLRRTQSRSKRPRSMYINTVQ